MVTTFLIVLGIIIYMLMPEHHDMDKHLLGKTALISHYLPQESVEDL